ncbi:hypothetical protein ACWM9A_06130 [Acetobacter pasteurianus]
MNKYCITAARPMDAEHHVNSEFWLWRYEERPEGMKWISQGWKRVSTIAALLEAGHELLTAKRGSGGIRTGAAVELELRISHNETEYKISEMPDE